MPGDGTPIILSPEADRDPGGDVTQGVIISNSVVVLFPGPYGVCAHPVALAGSAELQARKEP